MKSLGPDAQIKLLMEVFERFPGFKKRLNEYRKKWHLDPHYNTRIIVKGVYISDKVIREMDL